MSEISAVVFYGWIDGGEERSIVLASGNGPCQ
jgi:hypothetical protein